ncbi:cyclin-dependent kinase G-2 [Syzygium oleosum]|uniref:cyclin-dependent kinase G-2 n=1 Tax=Syzygium oleosum TaxID=219896 RepID=UPI0024BB0EFA|nr:cyclin-dependent kinase G-2 [Syzygium oleosum]
MATGKSRVSRRLDCSSSSRRDGRDLVRATCRSEFSLHRGHVAKRNDGRKMESKNRDKEHQLVEVQSGAKLYRDGVQPPPEKKRKFSPILWDVKDREIRISSKNRVVSASTILSPPMAPSTMSSNDESGGCVLNSSISLDQVHGSDLPMGDQSISMNGSGCKALALHQEQSEGGDQDDSMVEDGEFVHERNISMSRWASDSDSPRLICASDDEEMTLDNRALVTNRSSPESGEFLPGGSVHRTRSSGSDEIGLAGRASVGESEDGGEAVVMDVDHTYLSNADNNQDDTDDESNREHQVFEASSLPARRSINMLDSCRSVFEYERLNKINEGTYGVVYRARDKKTGEIVALKKVKMNKQDSDGGFPLTSLREINILLSLNHPSVVGVKEVVMGDADSIFMVMEYMEHDLKGLMETRKRPFSTSEVKCLMLQLLEGVKYLHDNWVLHRDFKTSNLLLNNKGELKICDFGLSRQYGSPLKPYTPLVVTMWYRAPELLLGAKQYSTAIDMWSIGCIMAEMLASEPLFKGNSEVNQLDKIFRTLGTPSEKIWPGFSELPGSKANFVKQPYNLLRKKFPAASFTGTTVLSESGFDLLNRLLTYDPEMRITADEALEHDWFCEVPLPTSKDFMPTFPPLHTVVR